MTEDELSGRVLDGRYEIHELLGSGGMGRVYRASQLGPVDMKVAIKVLNRDLQSNERVVARFENEARIIAQLRHPNTLRLIGSGRLEDGRLYIVTELLIGSTLEELLKAKAMLQVTRALAIGGQIADALVEAHGRGVIHRDLKPGNIFIETVADREIVRVLDFGIAKVVNAPGVTQPLQIFGTPGYMAPEQCRAEPVDPRTDIYALGALLYHSMTGHPPFPGTNAVDVIVRTIQSPPPPPSRSAPAISAEVEALLLSMLAKDPNQRPRSAIDVRRAIEDILHAVEWGPTDVRSSNAEVSDTVVRESSFDEEASTAPDARPPPPRSQRPSKSRPRRRSRVEPIWMSVVVVASVAVALLILVDAATTPAPAPSRVVAAPPATPKVEPKAIRPHDPPDRDPPIETPPDRALSPRLPARTLTVTCPRPIDFVLDRRAPVRGETSWRTSIAPGLHSVRFFEGAEHREVQTMVRGIDVTIPCPDFGTTAPAVDAEVDRPAPKLDGFRTGPR